MSTLPVRAAMVPASRRIRAYFAPINRITGAPSLFDPGKYGRFLLDAPPSPWLDLGWIDSFQRFCGTSTQPLWTGNKRAPSSQFHGPMDVRIEFAFREWGKLQMALAGGSEHMNVLASSPNASAQPSGGICLPAIASLPGSTASEIIVGAGAVGSFSAGDLIAVDADYQQQTGYVGTGIAAAYVNNASDVNQDANYIRRVTFNIGQVAQLTGTSLLLAQPLLGGAPPTAAGIQKVVAFVDREGGAFFQEWSGLFVAEEDSGGRICFHYPRLSPTTSVDTSMPRDLGTTVQTRASKVFQREEAVEIAETISCLALRAAFQAMPHIDENDGQVVVCYRSYFPANLAALY
ncbi:MAG TPA: hypothetical protein VFA74_09725 [Terriglobales bacterium]|nr:hypothetical protein [Terriglobales bacterium]